jgi:hypothetical protein
MSDEITKKLSVHHSIELPQGNSNLAPRVSVLSFEVAAAPVSLPPASRTPQASDRKVQTPSRPAPLVIRPERPDREAEQEQGKAKRGSSATVSSRTTKLMDRNRQSVLPNPWDNDDNDAKPPLPAFDRAIIGMPSVSASSVRSGNSFKAGLPRTPREPRTFLSP